MRRVPVESFCSRARYGHLANSRRRATPERGLDLIGELQLLALQFPEVGPDDPDPDDIVALGGHSMGLVTDRH